MANPAIAADDTNGAVAADSDSTFNVAAPASLATNDLLVAAASCDQGRTITTPSGWTKKLEEAHTSGARFYWFIKKAVSGDVGANITFAGSAGFYNGRAWVGRVPAADWDGTLANIIVDAGDPGSHGADDTVEYPSITTTTANTLVLYGVGSGSTGDSTLSGYTEEYDAAANANNKQLAVYSKLQATAATVSGAVGSITFTSWAAGGIAVPPAGGGGGGSVGMAAVGPRRQARNRTLTRM